MWIELGPEKGNVLVARLTLAILVTAVMPLNSFDALAQQRIPDTSGTETRQETLPNAPEPQPVAPRFMSSSEPTSSEPTNAAWTDSDLQSGNEQQRLHSANVVDRERGHIAGTVINSNGEVVRGATIVLDSPRVEDRQSTIATDRGTFQFSNLKPGVPYRLTIEKKELAAWRSEPIILAPGQFFYVTGIELRVPTLVTSVTVYESTEQIAAQQVTLELKQRVLGFIPNFYVTYEDQPVPLTTKLKFKLALKADTDPMTFVGVAFMSGIYQAGDVPDYGQGAEGFGKRMGAGYADTTSDIFLGGAIYPWLFRQDPRYFYQGTGTVKSRLLHALSSPYICKGDNGKTQPNYSSLAGDLSSGAISNLYYPESNRGTSLLIEGFAITTGVRTVNAVIQEFLIRKLTPAARAFDRR